MPRTARVLADSPSLVGLYAKVAYRAVASRWSGSMPSGSGRGSTASLPGLELRLPGVTLDHEHLSRYAGVCGFDLRRGVPATYPHVLAFPLHLELMTETEFPFDAMGLVHVTNRITQTRPLKIDDEFDLRVHARDLAAHPRGRTVTLVSEVVVDDEVVWSDHSVLLHRMSAPGEGKRTDAPAPRGPVRWRLDADLGRRYGAVAGDRNPIHLSRLTARAFGFRRPIAHGMWTKAKVLATLGHRVPPAFTVDVAFTKPIELPSTVFFGAVFSDRGRTIDVGVTSGDDRTHLVGRISGPNRSA